MLFRSGDFYDLLGLARSMGRTDDPLVRQGLARVYSTQRVRDWARFRAAAAIRMGGSPGPEGSIGKLALSQIARDCNDLYSTTGGAQAMLRTGPDPLDAVIAEVLVSTPAQSIAGGTDEIQHNILGENILGLPKEPDPNRGKPFREEGRL